MAEVPGGEIAESAGSVVSQKVGPLPLVVWVAIGAGAIGLFIAWRSRTGGGGSSAAAAANAANVGPGAAASFASVEDVQNAAANVISQVTGGNAQVLGAIGDVATQLSTFTQATQQQFASLAQSIATGNASAASANAALAQIQNEVSTGQANATQAYNALTGLLQTISQQQTALQQQGSANANNQAQQLQQIAQQVQAGADSLAKQIGGVSQQLSDISQQIANLPKSKQYNGPDFSSFNGQLIYSEADSNTYYVVNGMLYGAGFWARSHQPGLRSSVVSGSLKDYSQGDVSL